MKKTIKPFSQFIYETESLGSESSDLDLFIQGAMADRSKRISLIEAANRTLETQVLSCWDPVKYKRLNQIKKIYGLEMNALASYCLAFLRSYKFDINAFIAGFNSSQAAAGAIYLYLNSIGEESNLKEEMEEFTACLASKSPTWASWESFIRYYASSIGLLGI